MLDGCLSKKGFQMASKCSCYDKSQEKTVSHVFLTSDTADIIWEHFESILHIQCSANTVKGRVNTWWLSRIYSLCYKAILYLILNSTCWELWLNRNNERFNNSHKQASQIIDGVKRAIRSILSGNQLLQK